MNLSKFSSGLSAALISATSLVMVHYPVAVDELDNKAIASIAEAVTVFIDAQESGSGVIIGKEGNTYSVLTAKHVVPRKDEYYIVTPDQKEYKLDYSTVKELPDLDLAIVQFTSKQSYNIAKLGNSEQIKRGQTVYVAGWPHPEQPIPDKLFVLTDGIVAARAPRALPEGYQLIYTNVTRIGMSGGPVLDEKGVLIGIHGQSQQREVVLADDEYETGKLKTGFNLGIPINSFVAFLVSAPPARINLPESIELPELPESPEVGSPQETAYFTQTPRLVDYATTQKRTYVRGATYYFTISLPENAGAPIQQLNLEQRQGVDFLERYHIEETRAFEGTRSDRGAKISLGLVAADRKNRTIAVTFDPPVPPGKTVTVGLRPVFTPRTSGVYLLRATVFPPGKGARGITLGVARFQFFSRQ